VREGTRRDPHTHTPLLTTQVALRGLLRTRLISPITAPEVKVATYTKSQKKFKKYTNANKKNN
jgi:hypothetical protein